MSSAVRILSRCDVKRVLAKQVVPSIGSILSPVVIIDVREPEEVQALGKIPTAVNVPMNEVPALLALPPTQMAEKLLSTTDENEIDEFEPDDAHFVFYCKSGVRSAGVRAIAVLFFTHARELKLFDVFGC